jgi:hypothetical protein
MYTFFTHFGERRRARIKELVQLWLSPRRNLKGDM